jgi:hypothetical protein
MIFITRDNLRVPAGAPAAVDDGLLNVSFSGVSGPVLWSACAVCSIRHRNIAVLKHQSKR